MAVLTRGCRSTRHRRRLPDVYSFNTAIVPQTLAVDNVFGGELMAMCHETTKEERNPPLPRPEVLTSALHHTGACSKELPTRPLQWREGREKELNGGERTCSSRRLPIANMKANFTAYTMTRRCPRRSCYSHSFNRKRNQRGIHCHQHSHGYKGPP